MNQAITAGIAIALNIAAATHVSAQEPSSKLLNPENHTLILIDHQMQMAFATASIDTVTLRNNVAGLAASAKAFDVPVILTTVAEESFSGPVFPEVVEELGSSEAIDRTTMNTWEDERVVKKVEEYGRKRLVIAALWTEVCGVGPVLSAIDEGYEVYFVTDASGGVSTQAHDMAIERMIQAGATPITWLQYLLELQRDWSRGETYEVTTGIAKKYGGAYGLGIIYAKAMFGASEGH